MSLEICQYWMCEPRNLRQFIEKISGLDMAQLKPLIADAEADAAAIAAAKTAAGAAPVTLAKSGATAIIPVSGILLQRIPQWLNVWIDKGYVQATGLDTIRRQVQLAAADPEVTEIRLDIHSPGGTVAGTMEAAEAIFTARQVKPVVAQVETLAASAAYYLASQASRIDSGADAEIGSIGVFGVYYDTSAMGEQMGIRAVVIASGPHKGVGVDLAPITDEQIAAVKQVIDDMAAQFVGAVAGGRGMTLKAVRTLADGRLWLAPRAHKLGLIDHIQNANIYSDFERKQQMENDQEKQQHAEALAAARAEGASAAATRLADLRAAFADDLEFAMTQFEAGADVQQAKAAYCDVLADKLKAQGETLAQLQVEHDKRTAKTAAGKPSPKTDGAEPLAHGSTDDAEPGAAGGQDVFMQHVAQYRKDGLTRGQAMRKAVIKHPDDYQAHLERQTVAVAE